MEQGDFSGAIKEFNKVIEVEPDYQKAYYYRGFSKFKRADYRNAIQDLNKAIEINPNDFIAFNTRGNVNMRLDDYESAVEDFSKAFKLNPQYENISANLISAKEKLSFSLEIQKLNKAVSINPNDSELYLKRGNLYKSQSKFQEALYEYTKAIECDQDNIEAFFNRGKVHEAMHQYQKAIDDYSGVIKINPNHIEAYYYRGYNQFYISRNFKKALEDFNKVIEINPNYKGVYYRIGLSKLNLGDQLGALQEFNMAIEVNPLDIDAYINRAYIELDFNDFKAVLKDYNKVIEIEPDNIKGIKLFEDYKNVILQSKSQLQQALEYRKKEEIKKLIHFIADDLNCRFENGNTALHYAAEDSDTEIAEFLIKKGANINLKNEFDETPLQIAIFDLFNRFPKGERMAKMLISKGADVNVFDKKGHSLILKAIEKDSFDGDYNDNTAIFEFLVKNGAKIYSNYLHYAIKNRKINHIKLLIAYGVPINYRDKSGLTPLSIAELLSDGSDTDTDIEGWADYLKKSKYKIIKILESKGAYK
jgi:tetratricopeptide (TPR) repeat protein